MINIKIIAIGKIKNKSSEELFKRYKKMFSAFGRVKFIELKAESFGNDNSSKNKAKSLEGERITNELKNTVNENVYLLTEIGQEYDSLEFSKLLSDNIEIVFVIAGSLGFPGTVLKKYKNKLSLSRLTFPHEIARVILMEQIYRGATIQLEKNYHY